MYVERFLQRGHKMKMLLNQKISWEFQGWIQNQENVENVQVSERAVKICRSSLSNRPSDNLSPEPGRHSLQWPAIWNVGCYRPVAPALSLESPKPPDWAGPRPAAFHGCLPGPVYDCWSTAETGEQLKHFVQQQTNINMCLYLHISTMHADMLSRQLPLQIELVVKWRQPAAHHHFFFVYFFFSSNFSCHGKVNQSTLKHLQIIQWDSPEPSWTRNACQSLWVCKEGNWNWSSVFI